MKILHTSDWHLGRSLYGRKRYDEFAKFLDWLSTTIKNEKIDILLVAGDIFDTIAPSNKSQEMYYRFLVRVANSQCKHVVIIAGNHDSPSFLDAPKDLLRELNVHIVGAMKQKIEDELIVLEDEENNPQAIICAVPYLRDRDVRTVEAGESSNAKMLKLMNGIKDHYAKVVAIAEDKRMNLSKSADKYIPIIAMGHLFTADGKIVDGDGVRELYVGSLAHVGSDVFSTAIDYVALGHLHVPQKVSKKDHIRYSGSPIAMGFGEAKQIKSVVIIDFYKQLSELEQEKKMNINLITVPCFQKLERVVGTSNDILKKIETLKDEKSKSWLEIEYIGEEIIGNLQENVEELIIDTGMEVLRIKNNQSSEQMSITVQDDKILEELDPAELFGKVLECNQVPAEKQEWLIDCHHDIVKSLQEEDVNSQ